MSFYAFIYILGYFKMSLNTTLKKENMFLIEVQAYTTKLKWCYL